MMEGNTGDSDSREIEREANKIVEELTQQSAEYNRELEQIAVQKATWATAWEKREQKCNRRDKIIKGLFITAISLFVAAGIYGTILRMTSPKKYITPSRIEAIDIDPANEGLEQLLTIDGKQYTLQEKNGEPTLVKYEKKD